MLPSLEEEEARALGAPWQHQELEGGEEEWNGKQYPPGKEVFIWPAKSLREKEKERWLVNNLTKSTYNNRPTLVMPSTWERSMVEVMAI